MSPPRVKTILLITVALLAVAGFAWAVVRLDLLPGLVDQINTNTPTSVFILLFLVLPIFGFPMTPFLLVLGLKFGIAAGLVLLVVTMPLHMAISFALANLADSLISRILTRTRYSIPQVPPDKRLRFSFLVAAIPVAPYAVKNFLLPLAGIPFRTYLSVNWPCQAVLCVPAVVLGSSLATLNIPLFGGAVAAIVLVYLVVSRIEKKYSRQVNLMKTETTNE
ncbi:MAG: hypothetical protein ACLFPD_09600 [Desulfosudaceae bacterium]